MLDDPIPCESAFIYAPTVKRQRREFAELQAERADLAKIGRYVRSEARRVTGEWRLVLDAVRRRRDA